MNAQRTVLHFLPRSLMTTPTFAPEFRTANSIMDALTDAAVRLDEMSRDDAVVIVLEYDNGAGDIRYGTLPDDGQGYIGLRTKGWHVRYVLGRKA